MKLSIALLIIAMYGCASTYTYPAPEAKDLCLQNDVEIYPKYIMQKGRHALKASNFKKNEYGTDNITGTVSSVHTVSVVRLNENVSTVCMVEFTHELCADVTGLKYCN